MTIMSYWYHLLLVRYHIDSILWYWCNGWSTIGTWNAWWVHKDLHAYEATKMFEQFNKIEHFVDPRISYIYWPDHNDHLCHFFLLTEIFWVKFHPVRETLILACWPFLIRLFLIFMNLEVRWFIVCSTILLST